MVYQIIKILRQMEKCIRKKQNKKMGRKNIGVNKAGRLGQI